MAKLKACPFCGNLRGPECEGCGAIACSMEDWKRRTNTPMFRDEEFLSSAGQTLPWKIDCDAFTDDDWKTLAKIIGGRLSFSCVEGVPRGGLKLAMALRQYCTIGDVLIVDDVLTTGDSMVRQRRSRQGVLGVVVYDRSEVGCSNWIIPVFRINRVWLT